MLKAVIRDGFLQFLCSFLTHLTRTAVPSTATASPSGFLHQNLLAPGGIFCVEQNPHEINYKEIINLIFNFFKVEKRRISDGFLHLMRLFRRARALCRTKYGGENPITPSTSKSARSRAAYFKLVSPNEIRKFDNLTATDNIELMITP